MKIAFDAKRAFNNTTGLGNYSRFVLNGLLSLYPKEEYLYFTPNTKLGSDKVISALGNYEVCTPKGLDSKMPSLWRMFSILADLEKKTPDIYHGLSNELPFGLNRNKKISSVVTIHDLIFLRFPHLYNPIDRYIYTKKFKYAGRIADKVIAISAQTKSDLINYFQVDESKIEVIYQDCSPEFHVQLSDFEINAARLKYNLPKEYILTIGTVEKRKNQELILNALSLLPSSERPFLVIVGKHTAYIKEIMSIITNKRLEKDVLILNFVSFQDLPALYQGAKLFVYPSVFEGFGIPLVEALNSKTPVITSIGSCFSEAAGENSIYVDPYDPEALKTALCDVLGSESRQEEMVFRGYCHALSFRKEHTIPHLMKTYQSLK
jgi:glycosyltransferase involved in cell wall biosynthesis